MHYPDEKAWAADPFIVKPVETNDNNIVTPPEIKRNKELYDVEMTELGGIEVKNQMPFPDNNNPDTDFKNRFPSDMKPSGILNDLKKPTGETVPLIRKISDITTSTGVTITDEDIDKAINLGLSFSGGGLSIRKGPQMRKGANDNLPKDKQPYNPSEPDMLGNAWIDEALEASWKKTVEDASKGSALVDKLEEIAARGKLTEFDSARVSKLEKEYKQIYPERDIHDAHFERIKRREESDRSFMKYYEKYKNQTKEQRDIERAKILEDINPGKKVTENELYGEMSDLLAVKNPSGFEKDRIKYLNDILSKIEDTY